MFDSRNIVRTRREDILVRTGTYLGVLVRTCAYSYVYFQLACFIGFIVISLCFVTKTLDSVYFTAEMERFVNS